MDKNIFSVPNNTRTIDDFKARLIQGGARPNLFEVEMAFPTEDIFPEIGDTTFRMMIKGAQLPASNLSCGCGRWGCRARGGGGGIRR